MILLGCAGAVDLLEAVQIEATSEGVGKTPGFCPKRALRDMGVIAEGRPDLAYRIDEDAQLRVDLQKAFRGLCLP